MTERCFFLLSCFLQKPDQSTNNQNHESDLVLCFAFVPIITKGHCVFLVPYPTVLYLSFNFFLFFPALIFLCLLILLKMNTMSFFSSSLVPCVSHFCSFVRTTITHSTASCLRNDDVCVHVLLLLVFLLCFSSFFYFDNQQPTVCLLGLEGLLRVSMCRRLVCQCGCDYPPTSTSTTTLLCCLLFISSYLCIFSFV